MSDAQFLNGKKPKLIFHGAEELNDALAALNRKLAILASVEYYFHHGEPVHVTSDNKAAAGTE